MSVSAMLPMAMWSIQDQPADGDLMPVADAVRPGVQPDGLTERSSEAWRAFLSAHARVVRRLEAELAAEWQLALVDYGVFSRLAEAPARSLRMRDLASLVFLSPSRLTRVVDRLVANGLVAREPCPDDHRGKLAVLTPAGLDRLRQASPAHLRGVRQHFTSRLSDHELVELRGLMDRLG